jgi:hypothetical protein
LSCWRSTPADSRQRRNWEITEAKSARSETHHARFCRLAEIVDEYLADLPQLVHGGQTSVGAQHRAERYRWAYGLLGLRDVARKDGTLEVSGTFGERVLAPGEPRPVELPPPGYETGVLSVSSDSQR